MKVAIWCDMEGVAGICHWDQVSHDKPMYQEGRKLLTNEVNAAVRGAKKAGATQITVVDGHGAGGGYTFYSFIPELLEKGADYVFGHRWGCHVDSLMDGCDALLMLATHAKAGTPNGVLCHTISGSTWYSMKINGVEYGETALMAGVAGSFNIPTIFASGDEAVCEEVKAMLGQRVVTCAVKKGLGRYTMQTLAPYDACHLIEEKVYEAIQQKKWPKPLKFRSPVKLEVEFTTPDLVAPFIGKVGVEVTGNRTVTAKGKNLWECWDHFWHQR